MATLIHSRPARITFAALAGIMILLLTGRGGGPAHAEDSGRGGEREPLTVGGKPIVGPQPFAILLCRFADKTTLPNDRGYYERLFGIGAGGSTRNSPRGSVDHFWRELSYNAIDPSSGISLDGSKVFGWVTLPGGEAAYREKDPATGKDIVSPLDPNEFAQDFGKLASDCTAAAETYVNADGTKGVNFTAFKGIAMFFNGNLDGRSGGSAWWHKLADFNNQSRKFPTAWFNIAGALKQRVVVHEMGHGFGLPHSSGPYTTGDYDADNYSSVWDVMSRGMTCAPGANDSSAPTFDYPFRCEGTHTIAAHKEYLGWIPAARKYTLAAGDRAIVKLARLAQPGSSGMLMAKVPIRGSATEFYSVEFRQAIGYDGGLPVGGTGYVIIHKVDYALEGRNARLVDDDGNGNLSDGVVWSAGQTFTDAANDITIRVDSIDAAAGTAVLTLENKPKITITDVTVSEPAAPNSTAPARFTVRLSQASSQSIGLDYFTSAGTATKDVDYVHAEGHLSIPAGATTATITVNVRLDTAKEVNETFFVNLKNPIGATIADAQARGTIVDRAPTAPSPTPVPCPSPGVNCQEN